jgi:HTH-type transcriptional regulator/antitoxin HigA
MKYPINDQAADNDDNNDNDFFALSIVDRNTEFYNSYLIAKKLASELPKKYFSSGDDFRNFVKEVHQNQSGGRSLFRKKDDASSNYISLWLSRVRETAKIFALINRPPKFKGITLKDMAELTKLSKAPNNILVLQEKLFDYGVILIYEKSLPGMKVDGSAFRLSSGSPVIALSLRYSRLDYFWFTLMHELAHVALHYEMLSEPIIDDLEESSDNEIEVEADRAASNSLIRRSDWRNCNALYNQTDDEVVVFAEKIGVHPSIIAGRIQKELGRYSLFSKIVNEVNVRKVLFNED